MEDRNIVKENERLYKVLEVNAIISSTLNLERVLDTIMDKAKEVMEAEASSLMLLDEEKGELYFHTVKGEKSDVVKTIRLKLGEGISGWVAKEGKPVIVADCASDPRFYSKADQKSKFQTRTMMSVPLITRNRTIGTVQVLNKLDGSPFNEADLAIFQVMANQAAIAIENARLHKMATVDGMTGLYLKHYFLARLNEEFRRAKLNETPLSLIMSDIDHFKRVNDTYGHQGGDQALIGLAGVIREVVSSLEGDEIPGRYGGEEFCVLMPGASPERAYEIGEMIRQKIESSSIPIEDKFAKITISIGISSYPLNKNRIQDPEDFIKLADEALYICKEKGRNCVTVYSSEPTLKTVNVPNEINLKSRDGHSIAGW